MDTNRYPQIKYVQFIVSFFFKTVCISTEINVSICRCDRQNTYFYVSVKQKKTNSRTKNEHSKGELNSSPPNRWFIYNWSVLFILWVIPCNTYMFEQKFWREQLVTVIQDTHGSLFIYTIIKRKCISFHITEYKSQNYRCSINKSDI